MKVLRQLISDKQQRSDLPSDWNLPTLPRRCVSAKLAIAPKRLTKCQMERCLLTHEDNFASAWFYVSGSCSVGHVSLITVVGKVL
jgi:hypothetical protein